MKNIKKIMFLLIIVLIILVGVLLSIYLNPINMEIRYIYNTKKEGKISIMPQNVSYFFSYHGGNIEQRSLYKALDIYVNSKIEKYYKEINTIDKNGITTYYKNNSKEIFKELGIEDEEQFNSFISEIRKLNGDSLILEEYTFYPEKAKKRTNYLEGIILVKYNNNDKIAFNVRVLNFKDEERTPITLLGNVSSEYYNYEYEAPKESSQNIDSPGKVVN